MPSDKAKKLKDLLSIVNDGLGKEEFVKAFKTVLEQITALEKALIAKIDTKQQQSDTEIADGLASLEPLKQQFRQAIQEAKEANETTFASVRQRAFESINSLFAKMRLNEKFNSMMDEMMAEHQKKMVEMDSKVATIPSKEDFQAMIPEEITPVQTRYKLESLKGDERLDISAIKGIDKMEESIRASIPSRVQTPAKAYKIHLADVSSQCDGANKTFYTGGTHFGIVSVCGTQFPLIYRPLIDYTETATGFALTAAVSAPDTGQTLVAQFLK